MKRALTAWLAALLVIGAGAASAERSPTAYYLAYAVQDRATRTLTLYGIDPANPENAALLHTMQVPPGWGTLSGIYPGPDGTRVLFSFYAPLRPGLELLMLHLQTGSAEPLTGILPYMVDYGAVIELVPDIQWAPDGRRLAFNHRMSDAPDVVLYDLATRQITNLTRSTAAESKLAWSADGARLAALHWTCQGETCRVGIDLYDMAVHERLVSAVVAEGVARQRSATFICHLAWSPGGAYLSFVRDCDVDARQGLYLLDSIDGSLRLLTGAETVLKDLEAPGWVSAAHVPRWISDTVLFVGASVTAYPQSATGENLPPISFSQTTAYDLAGGEQVILSPHLVQEWALNPVSGLVAYRMRDLTPDGNPIGETVQIAAFDGETLRVEHRLPAACDMLSWSPDGQWLVYRNASQYCWEQPFITIVEAATGHSAQHQLLVADLKQVRWIGWVAAPH